MSEQHSAPEVSVSPLRARIMHTSDPVMRALARVPQWVVLAGFAFVMVLGAVFRGVVGAVCFGLVSLVLAWVLYLSWPHLRLMDRMARVAALFLTVAVTIVLAVPR